MYAVYVLGTRNCASATVNLFSREKYRTAPSNGYKQTRSTQKVGKVGNSEGNGEIHK